MDIQQPFLSAWVATLKDGTLKHRELKDFSDTSAPFLTDLDTKKVSQFFYVDRIGNRIYGVDITRRLFLINGGLLELPLTEGEYQLIAFLRTPQSSNSSDPLVRIFGFGLQATIDGKNLKRVFLIYPDGSVILEE